MLCTAKCRAYLNPYHVTTTEMRNMTDEELMELEAIMSDGVAYLECGCIVEPDGTCPCGNQSPLLELGMI